MNVLLLISTLAPSVLVAAGAVWFLISARGRWRRREVDQVRRLRESVAVDALDLPDDVAPVLSGEAGEGSAAITMGWVAEMSRRRVDFYVEHHDAALSQQRAIFWASLVAGAVALVTVIIGVGLVLFAHTEVGVLTSVAAVLPGAAGSLLFTQSKEAATRAAENLRNLTASVERAEAIQSCLQIAAQVSDSATRDRIIAIASLVSAFPEVAVGELSAIAAGTSAAP
ncbi:hypothetical protein VSH64_21195 [Amycolatopsis rhabdoformis]|uniref:Cyanobacterial TRADD-N associated 2 transmembrane domain-containing protein n=1 Tax=Amycolatopsis rhabdoformis TaxID=1448059 RepID=A0ABZ1IK21_9PSEU|nr:hypothetical protein [Amycolatopsis rhabdoformis]WSE34569.1 hypothetical protein VSH64_21195 [Amycolatopsis rhabdoformis]